MGLKHRKIPSVKMGIIIGFKEKKSELFKIPIF